MTYFKFHTNKLLKTIRDCRECEKELPCGANPVLNFSKSSQIMIVGQAPGIRVHESSIPWNDPSGDRLREWLQMDQKFFYDPKKVAIVPMGFCYPGTGKSGDLPPRKECAQLWMEKIENYLVNIKVKIIIGKYAQKQFLGHTRPLKESIEECLKMREDIVLLPHPSPRNNIWLKKNPWFLEESLPLIRKKLSRLSFLS